MWHLAAFSNGRLGDSEIWYALAPATVTNVTVKAVRAVGGYTGFLDVQTVTGVDVAYFLSLAALGLFAARTAIASQRWR